MNFLIDLFEFRNFVSKELRENAMRSLTNIAVQGSREGSSGQSLAMTKSRTDEKQISGHDDRKCHSTIIQQFDQKDLGRSSNTGLEAEVTRAEDSKKPLDDIKDLPDGDPQNRGHLAESLILENRQQEADDKDEVVSLSGYEPTEEEIERQALRNLEPESSEDEEVTARGFFSDAAPWTLSKNQGPDFDQYIEKRVQELNEHFEKSQKNAKGPDSKRERDDSRAAWQVRMVALRTTWITRFISEVQIARAKYAQAQVRTPGFVRNKTAMEQAVEWDKRAEKERATAQQKMITAYNDLLRSGNASKATAADRIAIEQSLAKEGNIILADLIIALDSLSGIDSDPDGEEGADSTLIGSKEVDTIFGKISELAGQDIAADGNIEGSTMEGGTGRQTQQDIGSPREEEPDTMKEYRVGDKLFITDAGGGTVELATYKVSGLEPLEIEDTASEYRDSSISGIPQEDEDLGQSESSKGKGPARPDEPTSTEPPKRQPTDPSTSYQPCDTLSVGNLPLDVSEAELKEVFGEQRGYRRMSLRTKASGPMCYVQFDDTVCAMKALFLLQDRSLRNSVNGGIRLGFSRVPLGIRSDQPVPLVPAMESHIDTHTPYEPLEGISGSGLDQSTVKQYFERSPAGKALRDYATAEDFQESIQDHAKSAWRDSGYLVKSASDE